MTDMPGMADMPAGANPVVLFAMWAAMMAAMMLPGAVPSMLRRGGLFGVGYLAVWTAFSAVAALVHWELGRTGFLSPVMALHSVPLAALVVGGVGLYQWTPIKRACLSRCREGAAPRAGSARESRWRTVTDGMRGGLACIGCCWALMALLFVVGVMNVAWMAAIAAFVLVEKQTSRGVTVSRLAGVALVLCGVIMGWDATS